MLRAIEKTLAIYESQVQVLSTSVRLLDQRVVTEPVTGGGDTKQRAGGEAGHESEEENWDDTSDVLPAASAASAAAAGPPQAGQQPRRSSTTLNALSPEPEGGAGSGGGEDSESDVGEIDGLDLVASTRGVPSTTGVASGISSSSLGSARSSNAAADAGGVAAMADQPMILSPMSARGPGSMLARLSTGASGTAMINGADSAVRDALLQPFMFIEEWMASVGVRASRTADVDLLPESADAAALASIPLTAQSIHALTTPQFIAYVRRTLIRIREAIQTYATNTQNAANAALAHAVTVTAPPATTTTTGSASPDYKSEGATTNTTATASPGKAASAAAAVGETATSAETGGSQNAAQAAAVAAVAAALQEAKLAVAHQTEQRLAMQQSMLDQKQEYLNQLSAEHQKLVDASNAVKQADELVRSLRKEVEDCHQEMKERMEKQTARESEREIEREEAQEEISTFVRCRRPAFMLSCFYMLVLISRACFLPCFVVSSSNRKQRN